MIRTTWSHSAESFARPWTADTKKTPKRGHMAQKETVWQTHLHAAETSGSVNDQKFFDEVSGGGGKKKHSLNPGCFLCGSLPSVSVSLSENGKACAMSRCDWWTHPRRKEPDSLAEGRRALCRLSRDTLTIFESKGARALSRLTKLPARVMRGGSEGDSREARVSALLRSRELLMNVSRVSLRSCRQSRKYRRLDVDGSALSH